MIKPGKLSLKQAGMGLCVMCVSNRTLLTAADRGRVIKPVGRNADSRNARLKGRLRSVLPIFTPAGMDSCILLQFFHFSSAA